MKTLYLDIETAPNLSYVWGHYDQTAIKHVHEWYVLCVAVKWETGPADVLALPDYNGHEQAMLQAVWELLDEADCVVAHNGDKFDLRKLNARFVRHNMPPPSPYATVDTLKVARKYFQFNQNGLDPLAEHLGIGRKYKHQGFQLWERCMASVHDHAAWRSMIRYAKRDVLLLEKVHKRLRPWMNTHPRTPEPGAHCPACGSTKLVRRGYDYTRTMTYRRYRCSACGKWSRSRIAELDARPDVV